MNYKTKANIASVSLMSGEPGGFFDMHTFEAEGQRDIWKSELSLQILNM